jgi:hypothetical protein
VLHNDLKKDAINELAFFPLMNGVCNTGLTKPGEVGDFFALVSMKSPNSCQKAKI